MAKVLITYFFSFILMASVVAPTYVSVLEGSYEIEVTDLGEEEENNNGKESIKDVDAKIYYTFANTIEYQSSDIKKRIRFQSKNYTSYQKKLASPPPESLS